MPAIYPAMFFTVALLVTTTYFLMGGLPLLILQHDTPLDSRFIRGFFNVYYVAAMISAAGATLSYALLGRPVFASGAGLIFLLALLLRQRVLPLMDRLRERIPSGDAGAVRQFRKIHAGLLLNNLVLIVLVVWSLIKLFK